LLARAHLSASRYEEAVTWAQKSFQLRDDHPDQFLVMASALGHLGRVEDARAQLDACERLRPGYTTNPANWSQYKHPADAEHFLDGLRKAGLAE
jgi:adenylate cyclase